MNLGKTTIKSKWKKIFSILFWIMLWQGISRIIEKEILIAAPTTVVSALINMITEGSFWASLWFSFMRISIGFFLGVVVGIIFGIIAAKSSLWREILSVPMSIIKSTPVASFIIIALIWISSKNLSIFISFLMVLPIIYTNIIKGIEGVDKQLLEMTHIFNVGIIKKIRYIYIPEVIPFFISAATVSLGLCWKAGIAAEVIGIPTGSIGESLYQAKIYLNTGELFAWTIVIIVISVLFENIFIKILRNIEKRIYF